MNDGTIVLLVLFALLAVSLWAAVAIRRMIEGKQ
jgi:hypothetical protein